MMQQSFNVFPWPALLQYVLILYILLKQISTFHAISAMTPWLLSLSTTVALDIAAMHSGTCNGFAAMCLFCMNMARVRQEDC